MALDLTETPLTLKGRPVKKLIKIPEGILKGKRVIKIRADQLINLKKDSKFMLRSSQSEGFPKDISNLTVNSNHVLNPQFIQQGQKRVRFEVVRNENAAKENPQITSSFIEDPQPNSYPNPSASDTDPSAGNEDLLTENADTLHHQAENSDPLTESLEQLDSLVDNSNQSTENQDPLQPLTENGPQSSEQESELDRIKRELEETKMQVQFLQEQYLKKEKEALEYKRLLQLMNNST